MELAKEGFNIFFIDNHEYDSIVAKKELQSLGVKCEYIIYDFGVLGCTNEANKLKTSLDAALKGIVMTLMEIHSEADEIKLN